MKAPTDSHARLRLFCFPYAGGGASAFRNWQAELGSAVEVRALQLPGRENRIAEAPLTSMAQIAGQLASEMQPWMDRPFALFGYSMGSLVAFEVARLLRRRGYSLERLIAAALRPPHIPHRGHRLHILPRDEFADAIRLLKGTPDAVLQNRELMNLVLPAIQSDFHAYETYSNADEPPLDCAISAMGGVSDASVIREDLDQWRQHTTAGFTLRTFPGGHFFLHDAQPQLLWALRHDLRRPACVAA